MAKTDGVYRAFCAIPWALMPDKFAALVDILEMRAAGLKFTRDEILARIGDPNAKSANVTTARGSVAILPLYGVISQRMNMLSDVSGGTSTEQFAAELDALVANPQVSAIVLDVDSPGGSTFGVPELAAKVRAARDVKPIYAVANGTMASAAYWIASQATEIISTPSSFVGSIGVFAVHTDDTQADANAGITRTVISAGKYKAEGIGALTPEAKSAAQQIVDNMYGMFVADVAKGRGVLPSAVQTGYGEGRALLAGDAMHAGMVDRIATMDDVVNELTTAKKPPGRLRADSTSLTLAAAVPGGFSVPVASATSILAGAPPVLIIPAAAPKAKEPTVIEQPTGAQPGTAPDLAALQAKIDRSDRNDRIAELCALVGAGARDVMEFQSSDKTLVQIRTELQGRIAQPTPIAGASNITVGSDRAGDKPFASLGEQLQSIAAFTQRNTLDPRLMKIMASASGGSANVPSDGAFLIQQDFSVDLMKEGFNEGQLAAKCSTTEVSGSSDGLLVAYVDETSRATGSRWGGIQIYRAAEADSATAKKPKIGEWELRLADLIGAAYMTERLLQDAPAMQSVFNEGFLSEFAFVIDDEIIRGTGTGQCMGLKNSGATVSQTKESGQAVGTVVAENIINMWSRLTPRSKKNAEWYVNQEVEPLLQSMQIGTGASGQLVYMAPGGLSGSAYGTIYGRPVNVVEQCDAPGTVGDIILADLSQYKLITKGGIQGDSSIHVRFLNNERTFRWIARVSGAPKLKTPITPDKGTKTLSPFVTLAAR
jgi:HK97 family phage major capsid protein